MPSRRHATTPFLRRDAAARGRHARRAVLRAARHQRRHGRRPSRITTLCACRDLGGRCCCSTRRVARRRGRAARAAAICWLSFGILAVLAVERRAHRAQRAPIGAARGAADGLRRDRLARAADAARRDPLGGAESLRRRRARRGAGATLRRSDRSRGPPAHRHGRAGARVRGPQRQPPAGHARGRSMSAPSCTTSCRRPRGLFEAEGFDGRRRRRRPTCRR